MLAAASAAAAAAASAAIPDIAPLLIHVGPVVVNGGGSKKIVPSQYNTTDIMFTRGIALRRDNISGKVSHLVVCGVKKIVVFNPDPNANQKSALITKKIPGAENLCGIAFDKTGQFLIVVDRHVQRADSKFYVFDATAADQYSPVKQKVPIIINNPSGVAIAPNGQIYIYNGDIKIYNLDSSGQCTYARSISILPQPPPPSSDKPRSTSPKSKTGISDEPTGGIAFDMLGNIVVSKVSTETTADKSSIIIFNPAGDKLLGKFVCKFGGHTCFNSPENIAFDKDCKHLFVSGTTNFHVFDYLNNVIPKFNTGIIQDLQPIASFSGVRDGVDNTQGIAISNEGEIYVCDHRVIRSSTSPSPAGANQIKIISFNQSSSA